MQPLPGFRDFLPGDCAKRNYIFRLWREVARRYGFVEWDGPILEPTELYTKKSGPEIVAQLFNFIDKGERDVAMRPELTPTLARVVAAHEREFRKPLKWFSIGRFFRHEKQQRGRLREHFQLNCDIVGEKDLAADIELIALAIDVLRGFGFTEKDFVVRISDRQFWTDFLKENDVPADRWDELLQVIDRSEREPREQTVEKLGKLADSVLAIEAFDRTGKLRAIAGGGRYDNLIAHLSDGAVSMPALGFAMGDVVLGEMIRNHESAQKQMEAQAQAEQKIDLYVVIAKEDRRSDALAQIQALREQNYKVDYPLFPVKVPKQFQAAEQLGAHVAILFGDEWPQVAVKNLESGEQQLIAKDELLSRIESLLK